MLNPISLGSNPQSGQNDCVPVMGRSLHTRPSCQLLSVLFALPLACTLESPAPELATSRDFIYFVDGAGAGPLSALTAAATRGLTATNEPSAVLRFHWQTGLGLVIDHLADVDYKRTRARQLAAEIVAFAAIHPDAPIGLIAHSAGSAVAIFALEELPPNIKLHRIVLLGASISADYDLTSALAHVGDKLYVFVSPADPMLSLAVPLVGTADRSTEPAPSAGLNGFRLPNGASALTRQLYAERIETIPWRPDFATNGYRGGHFDVLNPDFVSAHIAPLFDDEPFDTPD